jgi:hypothetical protein
MKIIKGLRINRVPIEKHFTKDESTLRHNQLIIPEYEFIYLEDDVLYTQTFVLEYGMCGSGYCVAEWIHKSTPERIREVGTLHYIPKEECSIKSFDTDCDGNKFFTLHENNDDYYPAANIEIHFDAWIATGREKDKRQVYVFYGDSAVGKSYIAHHTDLKVYETDAHKDLEGLDYSYDIVVVGNKYLSHNFEVLQVLSKYNIDIIGVKFGIE